MPEVKNVKQLFIYCSPRWAIIASLVFFSSCVVTSGHSLVVVHGLLLLWSTDSRASGLQQFWLMGLVALCHVESSWTRNQTCVPALAHGFLTTGPSTKSSISFHKNLFDFQSCNFMSIDYLSLFELSLHRHFFP